MDLTGAGDRVKSFPKSPGGVPTRFLPSNSVQGKGGHNSDDEGNVDWSQPRAVQVIEALEKDHTFLLNEDSLAQILLDPRVADKKVAIISVAGAFRKGKSFLLNFFLRYLLQQEGGRDSEPENWLGTDSDVLNGFSWRGGSERETSGILVWSEPFILRGSNGEDIAVLLMDTQGAFDSQSTVKDCATIFALSTMLSSVQIYNLSQNVQEDDLQHLQLFTEYGRLALESSDAKPFQSLLFLVRDWSFPYEAEYGFMGGQRILDRRLQIPTDEYGHLLSDKQHPELQQLREHIRSCFDAIECFLMPHPGLKVATNPDFRGQLAEIETEFKQQLRVLVPRLLSPDRLVVKNINGQKVTCRELLEYFKVYITIFQGEALPEPKSMLLATAEANNLAAVASARATYAQLMEEVCGGDTPYMSTIDLQGEHARCHDSAIKVFKSARKMGGDKYSDQFLDKLELELEEHYEVFLKVNNGKNLFKSMRTPAVLGVILIVDYLLQEIFQLVGLNVFANMCSLILGVILITLCIWAYSRYSGNMREIGVLIDDLANWLWANILSPLTQEGMQKAVVLSQKLAEKSAGGSSGSSTGRPHSKRS